MATCGNKPASPSNAEAYLLMYTRLHVLARLREGQHGGELGLGEKGNPVHPTSHLVFQDWDHPGPPQACRKLKAHPGV